MNVRLYSHDATRYLATAVLPVSQLPDVIFWGAQAFHLKHSVDPRTGASKLIYTEATFVTVAETFVEDYLL